MCCALFGKSHSCRLKSRFLQVVAVFTFLRSDDEPPPVPDAVMFHLNAGRAFMTVPILTTNSQNKVATLPEQCRAVPPVGTRTTLPRVNVVNGRSPTIVVAWMNCGALDTNLVIHRTPIHCSIPVCNAARPHSLSSLVSSLLMTMIAAPRHAPQHTVYACTVEDRSCSN